MEELSETVWCPDGDSRWFYERARGAYEAAYIRYGTTPKKKKEFRDECPKSQKFSKTELAAYLVAWAGEPQKVCFGAQKNFNYFMNKLDGLLPDGQEPDANFYRNAVSIGILYEAAARSVRTAGVPAYRAQITAYLVARCASEFPAFRLDRIWSEQEVSNELLDLMIAWSLEIQRCIVNSAKGQNVTEWCKKEACWDEVRSQELTERGLPPEALPEDKDPLFSINPLPASETSPLPPTINGSERIEVDLGNIDDIELCCRLNEGAWAKIAVWGAETRSLDDFERNIVATMQKMAIGG